MDIKNNSSLSTATKNQKTTEKQDSDYNRQKIKNYISNNNQIKPHYRNIGSYNTNITSLDNQDLDNLLTLLDKNITKILKGKDFDVAAFFSTKDNTTSETSITKQQVYLINDFFINATKNIDLKDLLNAYKNLTDKSDHNLAKYDFLIRTAILIASEKTGAGIQSWEAYTKILKYSPADKNFWNWIENPQSWIAEIQGATAKFTEKSFIDALSLAKSKPKAKVVAYKGGFGAGKTSHGIKSFGVRDAGSKTIPNFSGSISPDAGKNLLRKVLPEISHGAVHIQGSNIAYNIFDSLINISSIIMPTDDTAHTKTKLGTVVYDSSIAYKSDIVSLIKKSEAISKACKIVEISRYDVARSLAVLARNVDGEDPRIPLKVIINGATNDKKYRADCMNAILESKPIEQKKAVALKHEYEFNCGNSQGTDVKHICTLKSGEKPVWNIDKQEAISRLKNLGLTYNEIENKFENITTEQAYQDQLTEELKGSVSDLLNKISPEEKELRKAEFSKRILPVVVKSEMASIEELYYALNNDFKQCISAKKFISCFDLLDDKELALLITKLNYLIKNNTPISYLDLPAAVALEINSKLSKTPDIWADRLLTVSKKLL